MLTCLSNGTPPEYRYAFKQVEYDVFVLYLVKVLATFRDPDVAIFWL